MKDVLARGWLRGRQHRYHTRAYVHMLVHGAPTRRKSRDGKAELHQHLPYPNFGHRGAIRKRIDGADGPAFKPTT